MDEDRKFRLLGQWSLYQRTRRLHDDDYFPRWAPPSYIARVRQERAERLAAWDREFPELRAAYDKFRSVK